MKSDWVVLMAWNALGLVPQMLTLLQVLFALAMSLALSMKVRFLRRQIQHRLYLLHHPPVPTHLSGWSPSSDYTRKASLGYSVAQLQVLALH